MLHDICVDQASSVTEATNCKPRVSICCPLPKNGVPSRPEPNGYFQNLALCDDLGAQQPELKQRNQADAVVTEPAAWRVSK